MKYRIRLVAILALAVSSQPMTVHADALGKLFAETFDKFSQCSEEHAYTAKLVVEAALGRTNIGPDDTIETFCSSVRRDSENLRAKCFETCESNFASQFERRKQTQQNAERERNEQAERERRLALEKQQSIEQRNAELKAGRVKPANLDEAAIVHGARPGNSIVSSPKLRADGALYYLHGKIKLADDKPMFFAAPSMSQIDEANVAVHNLRGIGRPIVVSESTDYFRVVVPKTMQDYYFANARIEGGFDLVGRYVANTKYKNALGQEKTAPVFEVVYFEPW